MALAQKMKALIQIIRPELPISAGICVLIGQIIAMGYLPPLPVAVLGFSLGFFLSSSAMIFNDYFDLEVDRINAPQRPLPSGKLSPFEALLFGVITGVLALGIAFLASSLLLILCLVLWLLGFLYNWKLKSSGIWGNLIVSTNVAMTIFIGGLSIGVIASPMVWIFGVIAFFFDLAEEIAGDAMDMAGDMKRDSKSLAIVYGRRLALTISAGLFGLVILLTALPVLLRLVWMEYLIPIAVMDILIICFTSRLMRSKSREEGHRWMRRLYLSATIGLVTFIIIGFVR